MFFRISDVCSNVTAVTDTNVPPIEQRALQIPVVMLLQVRHSHSEFILMIMPDTVIKAIAAFADDAPGRKLLLRRCSGIKVRVR